MHASPKYPVVQWDGTNTDEVLNTGFQGWYEPEDQLDDGTLRLRSYWQYIVVVKPTSYVCLGQVFDTMADLMAAFHVFNEEQTP